MEKPAGGGVDTQSSWCHGETSTCMPHEQAHALHGACGYCDDPPLTYRTVYGLRRITPRGA
jgi:hypothetical protein